MRHFPRRTRAIPVSVYRTWAPALLLAATAFSSTRAAVTLPPLISDHMVLQNSSRSALWGDAAPNEKVMAAIGGITGETTAGPDGKWRLELDLSHLGPGPFQLAITGENKITIADVVIGEVWVASGQSNMEFPLQRSIGAAEEIAASSNPELRQFRVSNQASATPQAKCRGSWVVAGPRTAGGFTAVGYYFAKKLQQALQRPVGLIHSSWGGTPVESWISREALETDPDLKAASERLTQEAAQSSVQLSNYLRLWHDWVTRYARSDRPGDPAPFIAPDPSAADWKAVTLPGKLSDAGLPAAGAIWIRKTVTIHGEAVKSPMLLDLANLQGYDTLYYNGKKIAEVTPENFIASGGVRRYYPTNSVDGDNVIAIRIYEPTENAGISGPPDKFAYGNIPLAGQWLARVEYALPPLTEEARQSCPVAPKAVPGPQLQPAALYNGMIHPLLAYTMAGVIWYQGENNVGRAHQYGTTFPLMITDWRQGWQREFPFLFCQLPGFGSKYPNPTGSAWAELREAQTKALSLPDTGMAVLIDLGETADIHPREKKIVGDRLGAIALARCYGKAVPDEGPIYESCKVEGPRIRILFRDSHSALVAKPVPATYVVSSVNHQTGALVRHRPQSELEGFQICGQDHQWVWADAAIDGQTVVVSNPSITDPVAVRYAWANSPDVNLYNAAGLPAAPFRTDDFPGVTEHEKY